MQGDEPLVEVGSKPRAWSGWRQAAGLGLSVWVASRLGMAILAYLTMIFISPLIHHQTVLQSGGDQLTTLLGHWLNWDSGWYIGIASRGYNWAGVSNPYVFAPYQPTAFFPLYPLLIRGVGNLLQHLPAPANASAVFYPWGLAALIVSNLSALVGFIAVAALAVQERWERHQIQSMVLLLAAYPVAFYLANGYSEAILLATGALTLLFARRGQWLGAAAAAGLAALTRGPGLLVILPVAWEYGRQHHWWSPSQWRELPVRKRLIELGGGVMVILAAPAGTATYLAFLWRRFGDPLLLIRAEHLWTRRTVPPWETARLVGQAFQQLPATVVGRGWQLIILLDAGMLLLFIAVIILSIRVLPFSFSLYSAGLVGVGLITVSSADPDPITGMARYLLPAFPVFFGLAHLVRERPGAQVGLVTGGFLLQSCLLTVWLLGTFVD